VKIITTFLSSEEKEEGIQKQRQEINCGSSWVSEIDRKHEEIKTKEA